MSASVSLPIVTGGVGAAVPTTDLGSLKTLIATGVDGIIVIEASGDGVNFIPVATVGLGQAEQILSLVCASMRVRATNGSANSVSVMANPATTLNKVIPTPPTNGPGAALDVSDYGFLTTILVTQPSGGGTIEFQVSQDGVNWTTAYQSVVNSKQLNAPMLSANFVRAVGNQATSASITICGEVPDISVQPLGPDGVAFGNQITWRPGATGADAPGGNVCTTWEEVYALIEKYRPHGKMLLLVDSRFNANTLTYDPGGPNQETFTGVAEVPAGVWDMDEVVIGSNVYWPGGEFTHLTFADNAFFTHLADIKGERLRVISKSTVSIPIIVETGGIFIDGSRQDLFCLTAAAKPLIQITGFFGGIWNSGHNVFSPMLGYYPNGAAFSGPNARPSLAPVLDMNGRWTLIEYSTRGVMANTITDSTGAGILNWWNLGIDGENDFNQSFVPGAVPQFYEPHGGQFIQIIDKVAFADSPFDAFWGRTVLVDSSGGAVTVNAPSAMALGQTLIVKDASGNAAANNITIAPTGAETVEGGLISANGGDGSWVADGAGNWLKISG